MRTILRVFLPAMVALSLLTAACSSGGGDDVVSSRAYKGHEQELDTTRFVKAYPDVVGSRLDDCQTCHTGGTFTYDAGGSTRDIYVNTCDYCHLIQHPSTIFIEAQPSGYADTLNPFGLAYLAAGRDTAALKAIDGDDSDGDGSANGIEIADLKYPGDPDSKPGQQTAPVRTFSLADIQALAQHSEFLLVNSHKQESDDYSAYQGVTVEDLLVAAGVDLSDPAIGGVSVLAPDGYAKDFTVEEITMTYPKGTFFAGLDQLSAECSFVKYPDTLPAGVADGQEIPDALRLMIAWQRDGQPMDPSVLDPNSGRINGEGPYRIIVPQTTPGAPDRGSNYSPTNCNDGYDYDDAADHNAGAMVRGVIAIRVNPLPSGLEDFDAKNDGWPLIERTELIIFGHGVNAD